MTQSLVPNVVLLKNESDRDFNLPYGPRERFILRAGEQMMVVEELAWHYLGRWWATNANPRNKERQMEYERLRVLYGAYEDDEIWEVNRPRITAWTPDGERITTIVDDPEGTLGGRTTPFARAQTLEAQVDMMAAQQLRLTATIESLQQKLANQQPTPSPDAPPATTAPTFPSPSPTPTAELAPGVRVPVAPATIDSGVIEQPMDTPSPGERLPVTPQEIPIDEPTKTRVSARGG